MRFKDVSHDLKRSAYEGYFDRAFKAYPLEWQPVSFERWCAVNEAWELIQDDLDQFRKVTAKKS